MPYKNIEDKKRYEEKFYQERKNFIKEYKLSRGCELCGYDKHDKALCFDHIDPQTKHLKYSYKSLLRWKEDVLMEELQKCRVLCANCHNIETHEKGHSSLVGKKQSL